MQTSVWLGWLTFAYSACELLLLILLVSRGAIRRWPSVFVYCAAGLSFDALLYLNRTPYYRYFALYWAWIFLAAVLRLWILADVFRAIPGTGFLPRQVPLAIGCFAASFAIMCGWVAFGDGVGVSTPAARAHLVGLVVLIDRAASIGCGIFLAAALVGVWVLRLGWTRQGALFCAGLAIKFISFTTFGLLISFTSNTGRLIGNSLDDLSGCVMLLIWCYATTVPPGTLSWSDQVDRWIATHPAH